MLKTKTRLFNISSTNATNGSFKSNVMVQLPDLAFHNEKIQNVYLSVNHCEVPNSFYIVNYVSNQFVVDGNTYIIEVGNYNVNSLIPKLLDACPFNTTLTYSNITNKLTFSNPTTSFTINGSSSESTINKIIGLDSNDYTTIYDGFNYKLTLPHVVNFLPLQRINFRSNFFKFNNYNSSDGSSDVFLPLQNNAGQLSMINYINQTNDEYLIQDRSITTFDVSVTDDYNRLINFNNIDWTLTFKIKIEYIENSPTLSFNEIINSNQNYNF